MYVQNTWDFKSSVCTIICNLTSIIKVFQTIRNTTENAIETVFTSFLEIVATRAGVLGLFLSNHIMSYQVNWITEVN